MPAPNWTHLQQSYSLRRHAQLVLASVRTTCHDPLAPTTEGLLLPVARCVDRYLDANYRPPEQLPDSLCRAERACMATYLVAEVLGQLAVIYDEVLAGDKCATWALMFVEWSWPLPTGDAL